MKAPRSIVYTPGADGPREFLSIAVRIAVVTGGKDGFNIQLFPDLRAPQTIFLTMPQMDRLLGLAEAGATENELWAELAKVPIEPLQPARSLYPRLRQLLVDQAASLREELSVQQRRAHARERAADAALAAADKLAKAAPVDPVIAEEPAYAGERGRDPDVL